MAEINLKKLTNGGSSSIDINFNSEFQGTADATIPFNVNLTDGLTTIVPTSLVLTGNDLDITIEPDGVAFDFPSYWQRTSYRTGDIGDRLQIGWADDLINPSNPKAFAELDYSSANWWQTLKNPLVVGGVSSTDRFVDVNGLQVFDLANNANMVTIDKLTGFMYTRNSSNTVSWDFAIDSALSYSITVNGIPYDDWYLASQEEFLSVFGFYRSNNFGLSVGGIFNSIGTLLVGTGTNINYTSTTVENVPLPPTALVYNFGTKETANQPKSFPAAGLFFVRKAQNLVTAP